MSGKSKAISEELYSKVKEALGAVSRSGDVSRKLQAIKSAKEHGVSKVAEVFGVSRAAVMLWIKAFARSGADGLKLKAGRGRKGILSKEETEAVRQWMQEDPNVTVKSLRLKIEGHFSRRLSMGAVHSLMKRLGFSWITPRPSHYRKKEASHAEFKKKSAGETEPEQKPSDIFF